MAEKGIYVDSDGVHWISPGIAARIWNERAEQEYQKTGHYSRWSVYQRKGLLQVDTLGGKFYQEEQIRSIPLRPHPKRRQSIPVP